MTNKKTITVCMGSSCFTRGNSINLEIIKEYLAVNKLDVEIKIKGALCQELCRRGPIIHLNEEIHDKVEPSELPDLLAHFCRKEA